MKNKKERKMNKDTLQGFLHFRKRGFVQKNGKAYNRKEKHKKRLDKLYLICYYISTTKARQVKHNVEIIKIIKII